MWLGDATKSTVNGCVVRWGCKLPKVQLPNRAETETDVPLVARTGVLPHAQGVSLTRNWDMARTVQRRGVEPVLC